MSEPAKKKVKRKYRPIDLDAAKRAHARALERAHWDGDCLIWEGAMTCGFPVIRVAEHKNLVNLRRLTAIVHGAVQRKDMVPISTCGNPRCFAKEHVHYTTREHAGRVSAKRMSRAAVLARNAKISDAKVGTTKLTREQAEQVRIAREEGRPLAPMAREWGVSKHVLYDVALGYAHKPYRASPWDGLLRR